MRDDDPQIGDDSPTFAGSSMTVYRRLWSLLFVLITISLWAQWIGAGAAAELQSEDGTGTVLVLYLLPLSAAVVAGVWHHPAGRLALFPISFLPGLAMLPDAEWQALASTTSLAPAVATFGLYLVVAASRPSEMPTRTGTKANPQGHNRGDRYAAKYRRFVAIRFSVMALLFGVITYGLFFSPSVQQALSSLDEGTARNTQHLFAVSSVYLGWLVAVYIGAIVPSLNWEYYRRRSPIPRRQQALLDKPGRLGRRIIVWLSLLMAATFASIWLLV